VQKWNECVQADPAAKVYNFSTFLDIMSPNWCGLIVGDYEACLALPVHPKLPIRTVLMPVGIQQLQLVRRMGYALSDTVLQRIAVKLKAFAPLLQLTTNVKFTAELPFIKEKVNLVLDLNQSYDAIAANFNNNGKRNVGKLEREKLRLAPNADIESVIKLYKAAYGNTQGYKEQFYEHFRQLARSSSSHFKLNCYSVINVNGELLFAAALLADSRAYYYVLGAPTDLGRKYRATYFFIDEFLRQHQNSSKIFDFEGSDLKNVADFYRSFGPRVEPYYLYINNRLPSFLRRLSKKIIGI
jgi:hypothetical protein